VFSDSYPFFSCRTRYRVMLDETRYWAAAGVTLTPILIPISGAKPSCHHVTDIVHFIPDIGFNIGTNDRPGVSRSYRGPARPATYRCQYRINEIGTIIGCPDIGVQQPPISSSILDTISGFKLCSPGGDIIMTVRP
jgi:hypothetical protein